MIANCCVRNYSPLEIHCFQIILAYKKCQNFTRELTVCEFALSMNLQRGAVLCFILNDATCTSQADGSPAIMLTAASQSNRNGRTSIMYNNDAIMCGASGLIQSVLIHLWHHGLFSTLGEHMHKIKTIHGQSFAGGTEAFSSSNQQHGHHRTGSRSSRLLDITC